MSEQFPILENVREVESTEKGSVSNKESVYSLKESHDKAREEYASRNKIITRLLFDYVGETEKRYKTNKKFRYILFFFLLLIIALLTFGIVFAMTTIDFNSINTKGISALISASVTYLASLLSILQIMTKYLFPKNEDEVVLELVKEIIQKDKSVESLILGEKRKIEKDEENN